ncbi:MAG: exosortase/archaeosortase family protein [Chloroflexi bacterium]|nr:exosortase/archaeosortase family protein [Chloroflexota bacterium]
MLGASGAALLYPSLTHAVDVWSTTEEFRFGFLIVPIVLALVWRRRVELRASVRHGSGWGLVLALPALLVYVAAWRMGIHALAGVAVSPLLLGAAIYLWGWRTGRLLAFPFAFLIFGLGDFKGLLDTVGFGLQQVTASGAALLARGVGVPVVHEGLNLSSSTFDFVVAEACSGMSSLVALLALASLWIYLSRGQLWARLVVLASVPPLVVAANSVRVALVLLVGDRFGEAAALGYFHGLSSLVLFGVALSGLLLISRGVRCQPFGRAA